MYSNDPAHPIEVLRISAFVKVPIYLSTRYVYLRGQAGQTTTKTVEIRAQRDRPLTLEPSHFDLHTKVRYRLEEVVPGKLFRLHFTNIPGPAETYYGVLKLRTNYPEKSEISIRVRGNFRVVRRSPAREKP